MGDFMVSNWAMILNNIVENVILWDGDTNTWQPPEGYLMEPIPDPNTDNVGIGWGWNGTNFVAPAEVSNPALDNPGSLPDVIN